MNITKITAARLYNTGNYEHVRYELTVEVPEGESPALALRGVASILHRLKPDRSRPESDSIERDTLKIVEMRTCTDEEWQRRHGHCVGTRDEVIARYEVALAEQKKRRAESIAAEQQALKDLDDLGGAATRGGGRDPFRNDD
jgi:hypothetical protein